MLSTEATDVGLTCVESMHEAVAPGYDNEVT